MTRNIGFMDLEKFKKLTLDLHSTNLLNHLHLGGFGEPTLHPSFLEMVRYVKDYTDFLVSVTTNASQFTQDHSIKDIIGSKIDKIIISIRHSVPEKIACSMPSTLKDEDFIDGILNLIELNYELGSPVEIDLAFLKETFYSKHILGIKKEEYLDDHYIDRILKRISGLIKYKIPTFKQLTKSFSSNFSRIHVLHPVKGLKIRFDGLGAWTTAVQKYRDSKSCNYASYGNCLGMDTHFSIYWNGDVSTCCADFDVKNVLGNVFEENDILSILSNEKTLNFVNNLRNNRMPSETCQICRGGSTHREKWVNVLGTILTRKKNYKIWNNALHEELKN
ncbi:MAG: hypothetical protein SCALA701_27160 [Candidatus Scalindua sp.]|nr:MAG: hypothetical protein SCALA701_27160 [Candidatus Scalindua sp.]